MVKRAYAKTTIIDDATADAAAAAAGVLKNQSSPARCQPLRPAALARYSATSARL